MQVVMCEAYGGPETLVVKSVDSPSPGPGEVKIRLRARGVSFTDVLRIAGQYHVKTEPPFIPGGEAAGEILQLGADVEGLKVGDRVLCGGGFAEETVQPASSVIKLPDTVAFEAAAAFRSNYTTAYYALQRGRLRPGETLLVHGAAGGVGLATVDMGKLMGARVIATARTPERLEVCKQLGADHVIDYSKGFRDQLLALTDKRGADVIFDPVGGDVFDEFDAMHRPVRPYSDRRLHQRPAGRGQDQPPAGQGCRGDRLHHRRAQPSRPAMGAAQPRSPGRLAGRKADRPLSFACLAPGPGRRRAEAHRRPQGDRQGVAGVRLRARLDARQPARADLT